MLYSPPDRTLGLWDTWLLQDGDTFHLFYLQRERTEIGCSAIGHAVTQDWLHWETLAPVLRQGTGSAWDAGPLMTGMVIEHEGMYFQFYGSMVDRVQRIGLAVSDDLLTWEKVGDSPLLEAAGPWYETDPIQAVNYETAWRDPYVFYHVPDACFYALICARISGGSDVGGGCVAVAQSTNLLDWTLKPPAYVSETLTCLEVPEYFMLNGAHYLSYTTSYHFGTPYLVADPYQATGTFYLISDQALSGYHVPEHDNALNAGMPSVVTNYVGRSIPVRGNAQRRLFYYQHVYPPRPNESLYGSLSAPKLLEQGTDQQLVLRYNPAAFDTHLEPPVTRTDPLSPDALLAVLHEDMPDGVFEAAVTVPFAGICFRLGAGREGIPEGLAVWIAPTGDGDAPQRVLLGTVHFSDGPDGLRAALGSPAALRLLDQDNGFHAEEHRLLRVVCRGAFVDVYVDDVLYLTHTYAPEGAYSAGGVGVFYAGHPKADAVLHARARGFEDVMTASKSGAGR